MININNKGTSDYCTPSNAPSVVPGKAVLNLDAGKLGDMRLYVCNNGYVPSGNLSTTCTADNLGNGKWSNVTGSCQGIYFDVGVRP